MYISINILALAGQTTELNLPMGTLRVTKSKFFKIFSSYFAFFSSVSKIPQATPSTSARKY